MEIVLWLRNIWSARWNLGLHSSFTVCKTNTQLIIESPQVTVNACACMCEKNSISERGERTDKSLSKSEDRNVLLRQA